MMEHPSKSKVSKFHILVCIKENISWFHISMENCSAIFPLVTFLQGLCKLYQNLPNKFLIKVSTVGEKFVFFNLGVFFSFSGFILKNYCVKLSNQLWKILAIYGYAANISIILGKVLNQTFRYCICVAARLYTGFESSCSFPKKEANCKCISYLYETIKKNLKKCFTTMKWFLKTR